MSKKRNRNLGACVLGGVVLSATLHLPKVHASANPYVGDIMMFASNFCPRGWANADGQLLAISDNDALFSLYGTTYGGDGRTTFALPDLRNRIPVGSGTSPGLSQRNIGQKGGRYSITLNENNLAGHSHIATTTSTLMSSNLPGTSSDPVGTVMANDGGDDVYIANETPDAIMATSAITSQTTVEASLGNSSITVDAQQPYITIRYCVALLGIYPSSF